MWVVFSILETRNEYLARVFFFLFVVRLVLRLFGFDLVGLLLLLALCFVSLSPREKCNCSIPPVYRKKRKIKINK